MVKVIVSDHAVLRYIERRYGVPVDKLRSEIEAKAYPAAQMGAAKFHIEDVKFCLSADSARSGIVTVKTVLERHMQPNRMGPKKIRKRESDL